MEAENFVRTNVQRIKEQLQLAAYAGNKAFPVRLDEAWERGGTERMFFDHPTSKRVMGTVEIDTGADVEQVRLELLVPPALAEKVIALVQGYVVEDEKEKESEASLPEEDTTLLVPAIPPTRDPGPDDLAEIVAEEQEGPGLPAEVLEHPELLGEL